MRPKAQLGHKPALLGRYLIGIGGGALSDQRAACLSYKELPDFLLYPEAPF